MNNSRKEAIAYYKANAKTFSLWNAEGTSPKPGQVLFNKETNAFRGEQTCKEQNIDFAKFKAGQLAYRADNKNQDYNPEA